MYHPTTSTSKSASKATLHRPTSSGSTDRQFCVNESCLSDEVNVRQVSSFDDVWLVTDTTDNTSWLMNMETPVCPSCGSSLRSTTKGQRLCC